MNEDRKARLVAVIVVGALVALMLANAASLVVRFEGK